MVLLQRCDPDEAEGDPDDYEGGWRAVGFGDTAEANYQYLTARFVAVTAVKATDLALFKFFEMELFQGNQPETWCAFCVVVFFRWNRSIGFRSVYGSGLRCTQRCNFSFRGCWYCGDAVCRIAVVDLCAVTRRGWISKGDQTSSKGYCSELPKMMHFSRFVDYSSFFLSFCRSCETLTIHQPSFPISSAENLLACRLRCSVPSYFQGSMVLCFGFWRAVTHATGSTK